MSYPYERRRFRRIVLNLPAVVEIRGNDDQVQTHAARIIDVSEGGMMLETRTPVAVVGEDVIIRVTIKERLDVHAKIKQADSIEVELSDDESGETVVRWSDGDSGRFGVEFIEIDSVTRQKLRELVERAIAVNGDVTKI